MHANLIRLEPRQRSIPPLGPLPAERPATGAAVGAALLELARRRLDSCEVERVEITLDCGTRLADVTRVQLLGVGGAIAELAGLDGSVAHSILADRAVGVRYIRRGLA